MAVRPDKVRQLRSLVDEIEQLSRETDQPYLLGCIVGIQACIDEMFGGEE